MAVGRGRLPPLARSCLLLVNVPPVVPDPARCTQTSGSLSWILGNFCHTEADDDDELGISLLCCVTP